MLLGGAPGLPLCLTRKERLKNVGAQNQGSQSSVLGAPNLRANWSTAHHGPAAWQARQCRSGSLELAPHCGIRYG